MATDVLESAIAPHLVKERTIPASTPANFQPPFPAYSSRFSTSTKDIVMAIIGIQHQTKPASSSLTTISDFFTKATSKLEPGYVEYASVIDNSSYYNEVAIAYWDTIQKFDSWSKDSGFSTWWSNLDPTKDQPGYFLEVFLPSVERLETIFSDNSVPEGAANMRENATGPVFDHVYWGSMRDRLPEAQTDELHGEAWKHGQGNGASSRDSKQSRFKVNGRRNLAVIRSGQDWSNTTLHERKLYLDTMHPVLVKGMDFLRDNGEEVGCISNRFMEVLDKNDLTSTATDKTFGLGYFDDLASLEGWSKAHPTHLAIFGGFLKYAKELQNNVSLRLFHEVMVLKSEQQRLEYVGCHAKTGMLASM